MQTDYPVSQREEVTYLTSRLCNHRKSLSLALHHLFCYCCIPLMYRATCWIAHSLTCCSYWAASYEKAIRFGHQSKNKKRQDCINLVLLHCLFLLADWRGWISISSPVQSMSWAFFFLMLFFPFLVSARFRQYHLKRAAVVTVWHCPGGLIRFQKCSVKVNQTKWRCEIFPWTILVWKHT